MEKKLGRRGDTLVQDLGDGRKLSVTQTPAGTRAAIHDGGVTTPVDPGAYGIESAKISSVGGAARLTVRTPDGAAVDYTRRQGGDLSEVIHHGSSSTKRK